MKNLPPQALTPPVDTVHYRAAFEKMRLALPYGYALRIDWRLQAVGPCASPHGKVESRLSLLVEVTAPGPYVGAVGVPSPDPVWDYEGDNFVVDGDWKLLLWVDATTGRVQRAHVMQKDASTRADPGVPADVLWAILNAAAAFKMPTAPEGTGPE